jgi:hypothetical protein
MTPEDETRKAVRDVTLELLDRMRTSHERRTWALNACPHSRAWVLQLPSGTRREKCKDCGAERTIP